MNSQSLISTSSVGQSSERPLIDIYILVVDDDSTTLSIVSSMLQTWSYKVETAKNPLDALAILRLKKGLFDLVVTDLHMPYMNGFELQKLVDKEFKLPVIMMSVDDQESVILKSLRSGFALYIVKPVNPDDLKNVWQYAVRAKKGKAVVIEDLESDNDHNDINTMINRQLEVGESSGTAHGKDIVVPFEGNNNNYNSGHSGALIPMNNQQGSKRPASPNYRPKDNCNKKGPSTKKPRDDDQDDQKQERKPRRKAKVVWTNTLHNRFLLAIRHLGLDKAVPKRILEFMNVPGLTRENVASHLQKYRLFLKKVAEKGLLNATQMQILADRVFRSSFAAGYPQLILMKNLQKRKRTTITPTPSPTAPFRPFNPPSHFRPIINNNLNIASSSSSSPNQLHSGTFRNNFPHHFQTYNNYTQDASTSRSQYVPPHPPAATTGSLSSLLRSNSSTPRSVQQPMQPGSPLNPVYQPNHPAGSNANTTTTATTTSGINYINAAVAASANSHGPVNANGGSNIGYLNNSSTSSFAAAGPSYMYNSTTASTYNVPSNYYGVSGPKSNPNYTFAIGNMSQQGSAPSNFTHAINTNNYNCNNYLAPSSSAYPGSGGPVPLAGAGVPIGNSYYNGLGGNNNNRNNIIGMTNGANFGYQLGQGATIEEGSSSSGQGFERAIRNSVPPPRSPSPPPQPQPVFPNVINIQQQNANVDHVLPSPPPQPQPQPQQPQSQNDVVNINNVFNLDNSTFGAQSPHGGGIVINIDDDDDFLGDIFLDHDLPPVNFQALQDEDVPYSDLSDDSYQAEGNNQVQNYLDQDNAPDNNIEQPYGQVQPDDILSNEQPVVLNPGRSGYPFADYFPQFEPSHPLEGQPESGEVVDPVQALFSPNNMQYEMDWDAFMDSLLRDDAGPDLRE